MKLTARYLNWSTPSLDTSASDYLVRVVAGSKDTLLRAGATAVVLQALLFALVLVLVVQYRNECPDDRKEKRRIVLVMGLTCVVQLILTNVDLGLIISHRDDYANVYKRDTMISAFTIFLGSFSTLQLQLSFNCRTFFLCGRRKWVAATLGFFILASLVLSIVALAFASQIAYLDGLTTMLEIRTSLNTLRSRTDRFEIVSKLHILCTLLTNLLITGAISTALWHCRTGFSTTDSLVQRLLVEVVGRMVPPVALAVAHVALLFSGVGIGSWLRVTASLKSVVCTYTVVTVLLLRVRKSTKYAFPETRLYSEKSDPATALHSSSIGSKVSTSPHSPFAPLSNTETPTIVLMSREHV